jgi:hypothetical protein
MHTDQPIPMSCEPLSFDDDHIAEASDRLWGFVWTLALETRAELGLRWWLRHGSRPTSLAALKADFRRSITDGEVLYVDSGDCDTTNPSIYRITHFGTAAKNLYLYTRHVWLDVEFDLDGSLEAASCLLKRLVMGGSPIESVEYRLLYADTVGRACFIDRTGHDVWNERRFALRCLSTPLDVAIEDEWVAELKDAAA